MANPYLIGIVVFLIFLNIIFILKPQSGAKLANFSAQYFSQLSSLNTNEVHLEESLGEVQKFLREDREILNKLLAKTDKILIPETKNSDEFKIQFRKMADFLETQVNFRKNLLKSIKKPKEYYNLYGSLAPEVYCLNKVRIGTIGDGGKWVCNPWNVPDDCVIFSLGLNNFVGFDVDFQKLISNRCQVFGFDSDEQNNATKSIYSSIRGKTMKALISSETAVALSKYTIDELAKMNNVKNIEILKIDIEGAEHTALIPFLNQFTVCQIYIEMHGTAIKHRDLLNQLGKLKYRLFSYEINGWSIEACEYSLIHESCVIKYGAIPVANYLDF